MESSQIEQVKKQLIQQIKLTFPEEKKAEAIAKIESMSPPELEKFLIQNNLIKSSPLEKEAVNSCVFCSILEGKIPTNKINENKKSIAILEINPISRGHSLILPKEHLENSSKLPASVFSLAKKIAKKIKTKLKPKEVTIISTNIFGHEILNIIPVYKEEHIGSPRKQATPKELSEIKKLLENIPKKRTSKKKKENQEKKYWLNSRIP